MTMTKELKDKWLEKLSRGSYKRKRYSLGSSNDKCIMAVAAEAAVELHIIPDCNMQGRDLLTDEELKAIGLSQEAQFYLSTMNDTYVATGPDKFPMRLINAVKEIPIKVEMSLLSDLRVKEIVPIGK